MPRRSDQLGPFNNSGRYEIPIGEESTTGRRGERATVTPEDIRGKINDILTVPDEAQAQLDNFIKNPSIDLDPEVLEVYRIINTSGGQNVSIIPHIEAALSNARLGGRLDELLVGLLIPAYNDGNLSPGLHQKVTEAIFSKATQGGRRR